MLSLCLFAGELVGPLEEDARDCASNGRRVVRPVPGGHDRRPPAFLSFRLAESTLAAISEGRRPSCALCLLPGRTRRRVAPRVSISKRSDASEKRRARPARDGDAAARTPGARSSGNRRRPSHDRCGPVSALKHIHSASVPISVFLASRPHAPPSGIGGTPLAMGNGFRRVISWKPPRLTETWRTESSGEGRVA